MKHVFVCTAAAAPPPFRPGNPALCGSRPLVTTYYCRLGDLLCMFCVHVCLLYVWLPVYYMFLQYFDTVGWVFWPVKTVSHVTCTVLAAWLGLKTLLNPVQCKYVVFCLCGVWTSSWLQLCNTLPCTSDLFVSSPRLDQKLANIDALPDCWEFITSGRAYQNVPQMSVSCLRTGPR